MNDEHALRERAKELRCLYRVNEIVSRRGEPPPRTFLRVLEAIPSGWQRPETTGARIESFGRSYVGPGYTSSGRSMVEPIRLFGVEAGRIEVTDSFVGDGEPPSFLPEESKLLRNIADRLGEYLEWKHTELLGERAPGPSDHWRWRQDVVEAMAAALDPERFGVERLFVGGSTESGHAGPGSDIDVFVVCGPGARRAELALWLDGWSRCLAELCRRQTGVAFEGGVLDVRWLSEVPDLRRRPDLRELPLARRDEDPAA